VNVTSKYTSRCATSAKDMRTIPKSIIFLSKVPIKIDFKIEEDISVLLFIT